MTTVKEFLEEVTKTYGEHFSKSRVEPHLAISKDECSHGYWANDMFKIKFRITFGNEDLTEDSELSESMVMEGLSKVYTIKPESNYMAYGSRKLNFRKVTGDEQKIIKSLDKFFAKLREQLKEDLDNNLIHDNHYALAITK